MTHLMKLRKMTEKNEIISHCFYFHTCKYFQNLIYFIIKENMIQITNKTEIYIRDGRDAVSHHPVSSRPAGGKGKKVRGARR
jgi:hypothetical protein